MEENCFFQFSRFSILVGKNWNDENWDLSGRGANYEVILLAISGKIWVWGLFLMVFQGIWGLIRASMPPISI